MVAAAAAVEAAKSVAREEKKEEKVEEERYRPKREYNEAPTTDLTKASRPFCLPFKEQPQSQTPSGKSLLLVTQNL